MTFEQTSISSRLDDVLVQKSPARPLYAEHSLVTWRSPLRAMLPPFRLPLSLGNSRVREFNLCPSLGRVHAAVGACLRPVEGRRQAPHEAARRGSGHTYLDPRLRVQGGEPTLGRSDCSRSSRPGLVKACW